MFQDSKVDKKRKGKETALNLTDTMFNFLRHAIIDANALLTSLNMGKLKDVLQKIWFIENHCNAEIMDLSKDAKSRQWLELIQTEDDLASSGVAGDILANDSDASKDGNATDNMDLDPNSFMGEGKQDHGQYELNEGEDGEEE